MKRRGRSTPPISPDWSGEAIVIRFDLAAWEDVMSEEDESRRGVISRLDLGDGRQ
jgi:hypothetical protein